MAVYKEARAYRESTHIVMLSVGLPCPFTKCNLHYLETVLACTQSVDKLFQTLMMVLAASRRLFGVNKLPRLSCLCTLVRMQM